MFHRPILSSVAATVLLIGTSIVGARAANTCEVTGTLHKSDGTPAANAQVTIVKVAQNGSWLNGYPQTVSAGATGFVDFIVPANSTAYLQVNGVDGLNVVGGAAIQIPDLPTASIEALWQLSGVTSFNGRQGDLTLSNTDIASALGYTPANSATVPFLGGTNTFSGLNTFSSIAANTFALTQTGTSGGITIYSPSGSNGSPLALYGRDRGDGSIYTTKFASGGSAGLLTNGYITINGDSNGSDVGIPIAGESSYMLGVKSDVGAAPTVVLQTKTGPVMKAYDRWGTNVFTLQADGNLSLIEGNGVQWAQGTPGLGGTSISSGFAIFNGTHDPSIYFGYNQRYNGTRPLTTENALSWGIEGNYNDGSGANKMEAYIQYWSADGLTNIRPIFLQFDKNTNALTAANYMGNPFNITKSDGSLIARFGNYDGSSLIAGRTGSDTIFKIQAPADRNGYLWIGSKGTDNALQLLATGPSTAAMVLGTGAFRFYNAQGGTQLAIGADDNGAAVTAAVSGTGAKKGVVIRGMANQSADLVQAQDSSSNLVASVNKDGGLNANRVVAAKTANYAVQNKSLSGSDRNTFFTNTGATDQVEFNLPPASPGLTYTFYVDAPQALKVTSTAGATIRIAGSVTNAGGSVSNATPGGCITLVAITSSKWVTQSHEGNWLVK